MKQEQGAARLPIVGDGSGLAPGDTFYREELQLAFRNRGMPLEGLQYDITPTGMHYLLTHFDIPKVDARTWRLHVEGLVSRGSDQPEKADLVDYDNKGKVREIVRESKYTRMKYTWGIAAWTPIFTNFLNNKLKTINSKTFVEKELFISDMINFAIQDGLQVNAVHVSENPFIDIGTPEGLAKASGRIMRFSNR